MKEIWKDIKGFSNYKVSNLGKIKNKKNKFLKLQKDKNGYLIVYLYNDDKKIRSIKVHRLVAEAFISNNQNKPQVNHKDGNKQNNCVDNLEWVTSKENVQHAWKNGLHHKKYGKEHNNAKKIIQYTLNGKYIKQWDSIIDASKYYNTTLSNIWHCLKGYNKTAAGYVWKYLK